MSNIGSTCVIAEAGVNHNGELPIALELVDVAAAAGADIVKFQTWKTELVNRPATPMVEYQKAGGLGADLFDLGRLLELEYDAFFKIKERCEHRGIEFLSTAFDVPSLEFLVNGLKLSRIKVPSGEAVNVPFLRAAARTGLPIILSTGMCNLKEVRMAIETLEDVWAESGAKPELILMQCTTSYPTPIEDVHLRSMSTLHEEFGVPVGLSDHSQGIAASVAAVALGAVMIEKHFTLDRNMAGPDHRASLEPDELRALVDGVRMVEKAMGSAVKEIRPCEVATAKTVRRSLVATRHIAAGETITEDMLVPLRPEDGIPARDIDKVVGQPSWRDFRKGEVLQWGE